MNELTLGEMLRKNICIILCLNFMFAVFNSRMYQSGTSARIGWTSNTKTAYKGKIPPSNKSQSRIAFDLVNSVVENH